MAPLWYHVRAGPDNYEGTQDGWENYHPNIINPDQIIRFRPASNTSNLQSI